jgi:uncharacterized iron-regulated membrane protein
MQTPSSQPDQTALHRWLWRWHGYAGLFVIPFIFFMALTGLPYVWEHELEDALHPEYRALTPQATRVSYGQQLIAARAACPDMALLKVVLDGKPEHATSFMFGDKGDPLSVYVSPYSGQVITQFREWTRLSFAAISLHGLTFIEPYGSWLLELLACWGIILCITGVYLWWPRSTKWSVWGVLLPRLRSDGRTRWRDLHAVTGFYFAAVLALYLFTGLPWTAFWGGKLLSTLQDATGQGYLTAMTNCCAAPPSSTPASKPAPLDSFVAFALAQHLPGNLTIEYPSESGGSMHIFNRVGNSTQERHYQLDAISAQPFADTAWNAVPFSQKAVALGIDMHEGRLFGLVTQLIATTLACVFMLMAGAAMLMWWKRRPRNKLDWPKLVPRIELPRGVKLATIALGVLLPMFGATVLAVLALERMMRPES